MASSTVRISEEKREVLRELAAWTGEPMQTVLERAIERYRREVFLQRVNDGFARLRADPVAWQEELAEREEWDVTLGDGLEDD